MVKTTKNSPKRDDIVRIVADMHGVSTRYVRMIRNGERENDEIMASLVDYAVGKNKLIKTLEKLVPIKPQPEKYGRKRN